MPHLHCTTGHPLLQEATHSYMPFFLDTSHLPLLHTNTSTEASPCASSHREPPRLPGTSSATASQRQSSRCSAHGLPLFPWESITLVCAQWHPGPPAELQRETQPRPLDARPLECSEAAPGARTYKAQRQKAVRRAGRTGLQGGQRPGASHRA